MASADFYLYLLLNHRRSADPLSESLLATATAPNAASKHKTIELHNPSSVVELKYSGTISFKWRFKWEEYVRFCIRAVTP